MRAHSEWRQRESQQRRRHHTKSACSGENFPRDCPPKGAARPPPAQRHGHRRLHQGGGGVRRQREQIVAGSQHGLRLRRRVAPWLCHWGGDTPYLTERHACGDGPARRTPMNATTGADARARAVVGSLGEGDGEANSFPVSPRGSDQEGVLRNAKQEVVKSRALCGQMACSEAHHHHLRASRICALPIDLTPETPGRPQSRLRRAAPFANFSDSPRVPCGERPARRGTCHFWQGF